MNKLLNIKFYLFNILDFIKQYYIIILTIIVLISLVIFVFCFKKNKKAIKTSYLNKTYTRQIKINIRKGTFTYLNLKKPNESKTKPISDFYSAFSMKDQEDAKNWITSLLDPSKTNTPFFERYVFEKKRRDYIFTTYKFVKANYIDQSVYIQTTIYPSVKKLGIIKASNNEFVSIPDLSKYTDYQKKKKKEICIYAIHLYNKSNLICKDYENEIHLHLLKLLNRYLSRKECKNYLYSLYDKQTLCLITFKSKSDTAIEAFFNYLMEKTYTYFSLHNLNDLYDYRIGIYFHKDYEDDLLINKAKRAYQAASYAKESSSKIKYAFYTTEIFENEAYTESLLKEALEMIKNNSFTTYYKPFIQNLNSQSSSTKTKGFICFLTPKSKTINSIERLEEILYNADEGYSYIKFIINKCTSGFIEQNIKKNNLKNILIKINYPFIKHVISYFKYNRIDDFSITFYMSESYFLNSDYDILEIKNDFNKLRQYGHMIGLNIENYKLSTEKSVLELFDLFVLDSNLIENFRANSRNTILTKNLIYNLTKTKTPILATGVKNWTEAELLETYGVNYIAGAFISKRSENIQEVDKNLVLKMQHKSK